MSTLKPIFAPLQQAQLKSQDQRQEQRATPFISEWKKVVKGQKLNIEHRLGRTPNVVQLEFSSNGNDIDGSANWNWVGSNAGMNLSKKDAREVILQAGKDYAGVTINDAGVQTPVTEGWVRVISW